MHGVEIQVAAERLAKHLSEKSLTTSSGFYGDSINDIILCARK